jgi:hypothetical protein
MKNAQAIFAAALLTGCRLARTLKKLEHPLTGCSFARF